MERCKGWEEHCTFDLSSAGRYDAEDGENNITCVSSENVLLKTIGQEVGRRRQSPRQQPKRFYSLGEGCTDVVHTMYFSSLGSDRFFVEGPMTMRASCLDRTQRD